MPKYLKHDDEGWWYDPFSITGKHDWYGPYVSAAEATRERTDFQRCWIGNFTQRQICTGSK